MDANHALSTHPMLNFGHDLPHSTRMYIPHEGTDDAKDALVKFSVGVWWNMMEVGKRIGLDFGNCFR